MSADSPGYVYFVQSPDSGLIKIGFARRPYERLAGLQTSHGQHLKLLGCIEAPMRTEFELHDRYAPWRKSGEWFEPNPDLMEMVGRSTMPPKTRTGSPPGPTRKGTTAAEVTKAVSDSLVREYGEGPDARRRIADLARVSEKCADNWLAGRAAMRLEYVILFCAISDDFFWTIMRLAGREEQLRALTAMTPEAYAETVAKIDTISLRFQEEIQSLRRDLMLPEREDILRMRGDR